MSGPITQLSQRKCQQNSLCCLEFEKVGMVELWEMIRRCSVMATSVRRVLTPLQHPEPCCYCLLHEVKPQKLMENACNWPHYVIRFTPSECSSWCSPGPSICFIAAPLSSRRHAEGTITLLCESRSLLSDLQPGEPSRLRRRGERQGPEKPDVISRLWLSEEM